MRRQAQGGSSCAVEEGSTCPEFGGAWRPVVRSRSPAAAGGGRFSAPVETAATIDSAGVARASPTSKASSASAGTVPRLPCAPVASRVRAVTSHEGIKLSTRAMPPMTKTRLALKRDPTARPAGVTAADAGVTAPFAREWRDDVHPGLRKLLQGHSGHRESRTGSTEDRTVRTATPTASGPITTRASWRNTSEPVTVTVLDAVGAQSSSQTLSSSGFRMAVGEPGGTPTQPSPMSCR